MLNPSPSGPIAQTWMEWLNDAWAQFDVTNPAAAAPSRPQVQIANPASTEAPAAADWVTNPIDATAAPSPGAAPLQGFAGTGAAVGAARQAGSPLQGYGWKVFRA